MLTILQIADALNFPHADFSEALAACCNWVKTDPPPLYIGHIREGSSDDPVRDISRDLMAICGIPHLIRRQRRRLACSLMDTLKAFRQSDSIGTIAMFGRRLLELNGVARKIGGVVESQGGQISAKLQRDLQEGTPDLRCFQQTPHLLRSLWERTERTAIDWHWLAEAEVLRQYQRQDPRYSDLADFRQDKESPSEYLSALDSDGVPRPQHASWGLAYSFLSEFIHPNKGAFFDVEHSRTRLDSGHPDLAIRAFLDSDHPQWPETLPDPAHDDMKKAAWTGMCRVLADLVRLTTSVAHYLQLCEGRLVGICQAITRATLLSIPQAEHTRFEMWSPAGYCVCLQPGTPRDCCLSERWQLPPESAT